MENSRQKCEHSNNAISGRSTPPRATSARIHLIGGVVLALAFVHVACVETSKPSDSGKGGTAGQAVAGSTSTGGSSSGGSSGSSTTGGAGGAPSGGASGSSGAGMTGGASGAAGAGGADSGNWVGTWSTAPQL